MEVETKICTICEKEKPASEFKTRKTGDINKRCNRCAEMLAKGMRKYWKKNYSKLKHATRDRMRGYRMKVINHYGGKCACCGESDPAFLSVDHIGGGGRKHRAEIGSNQAIYLWLIRRDFPSGFRVLCLNCNCAIGFYGKCPHDSFDPMTMIGACA